MTLEFHTVPAASGDDVLDWQVSTVVHALFYYAQERPDLKMYTFLGDGENETDTVTAAELAQQAASYGQKLGRFLSKGQRVVLLYESPLDYMRGLLGCLCAGLVPVSGVYPKAFGARDRFVAICEDAGAHAVIGLRGMLSEFQKVCPDLQNTSFLWIPTDNLKVDLKDELKFVPSPQDTALIQYTSGSTRAPRGVELTHYNIAHNLFAQAQAFGYKPGDCGVNWLPLSHDMGLIGGALTTLALGGESILLSPEHVAEKPIRWLKAISHYRATLSGGPDFMYGLCTRTITQDECADLDLSSWEVAFNGAEYIRPETMNTFSHFFADNGFKKNAFFACYGLAEATLLVTASHRGEGVKFRTFSRSHLAEGLAVENTKPLDARILASCGQPSSDIQIRITEPEGEENLPDGHVGEIRVHSPGVAMGYVNREIETNRIFKASITHEDTYFLRTGDRGFVLNGSLYITGRQDNRITVDNNTLDPEDIIASLDVFSKQVRLFSSAVFSEISDGKTFLVLAIEVSSGEELQTDHLGKQLVETVFQHFPVQHCKVIFLRAGSVFKTPSGKIRVEATKQALHDGSLSNTETYAQSLSGTEKFRILKIDSGRL